MLEIKPTTDKQVIAALCRKCRLAPDESLYAYIAASGNETLASALFQMEADAAQVLYYESAEPGDRFLFDGLLRAGFHFAEEQGVTTGRIPEPFRQLHLRLFERLNYPITTEFGIENFFSKYKNCAI